MCFLGIEGRPGVSWGVLGCPGVIRLTALDPCAWPRWFGAIWKLVHDYRINSDNVCLQMADSGDQKYNRDMQS